MNESGARLLLAANAASFGFIFGGVGLYIRILNYNNGEFYTKNYEFRLGYALEMLLIYSIIPILIMMIIKIFMYVMYKICYTITNVNKLILAWIVLFALFPVLYFGLTRDFEKLLDLPKYGLANAIAEVVNKVSPVALKVLLAELVLCTAVWLVVAGFGHWNERKDRSKQAG